MASTPKRGCCFSAQLRLLLPPASVSGCGCTPWWWSRDSTGPDGGSGFDYGCSHGCSAGCGHGRTSLLSCTWGCSRGAGCGRGLDSGVVMGWGGLCTREAKQQNRGSANVGAPQRPQRDGQTNLGRVGRRGRRYPGSAPREVVTQRRPHRSGRLPGTLVPRVSPQGRRYPGLAPPIGLASPGRFGPRGRRYPGSAPLLAVARFLLQPCAYVTMLLLC